VLLAFRPFPLKSPTSQLFSEAFFLLWTSDTGSQLAGSDSNERHLQSTPAINDRSVSHRNSPLRCVVLQGVVDGAAASAAHRRVVRSVQQRHLHVLHETVLVRRHTQDVAVREIIVNQFVFRYGDDLDFTALITVFQRPGRPLAHLHQFPVDDDVRLGADQGQRVQALRLADLVQHVLALLLLVGTGSYAGEDAAGAQPPARLVRLDYLATESCVNSEFGALVWNMQVMAVYFEVAQGERARVLDRRCAFHFDTGTWWKKSRCLDEILRSVKKENQVKKEINRG
jgi:hypothetical protein